MYFVIFLGLIDQKFFVLTIPTRCCVFLFVHYFSEMDLFVITLTVYLLSMKIQ